MGSLLICKQCKRELPSSEFLWNGKRGRIRVRFCGECAGANMRRYWSTKLRNMKADDVAAIDD